MKRVTTQAKNVLRPFDVFQEFRAVLRRLGLDREVLFAMALYFAIASRMSESPLRVGIVQQSAGNAKYLVNRVAELLKPGTLLEVRSNGSPSWTSLANKLAHKVVFLPQGDGPAYREHVRRFEIEPKQLIRIIPIKEDGRTVEQNDAIEVPFIAISADHRWSEKYAPRWLTLKLDTPGPRTSSNSQSVVNGASLLDRQTTSIWHSVQDVVDERMRAGVSLPAWVDVVIEQACEHEEQAQHLPAFLQGWKTMAVLRSLNSDGKGEKGGGELRASFEDLAATSLLFRKAFREGHWFPSVKKVFERIRPVGDRTGVLHPITGRGVQYVRRELPAKWTSVLDGW